MHLQILPIACYLLSISRTSSSAILSSTTDPSAFTIYLKASDYFPHSKTDLSSFDRDVYFSNFDPETKLWLTSLDPQTGPTDEAKARILTEISYAKKFDENDTDMIEDVQSILAAVTANLTTTTSIPSASPLRDADSAYFVVDTRRHVVNWEGCTPFYQCVTGTVCLFPLRPSHSPRNHCEHHGGSLCCISWSNYNVAFWFFQNTWLACDREVRMRGISRASCEGYGGEAGGNVCISNRARHC